MGEEEATEDPDWIDGGPAAGRSVDHSFVHPSFSAKSFNHQATPPPRSFMRRDVLVVDVGGSSAHCSLFHVDADGQSLSVLAAASTFGQSFDHQFVARPVSVWFTNSLNRRVK